MRASPNYESWSGYNLRFHIKFHRFEWNFRKLKPFNLTYCKTGPPNDIVKDK